MIINVTKSFLPPIEEYQEIIKGIWENTWLTNNGPLVRELENKLKDYLNVENLLFVGNGTIAIQIALKALELSGEIITTPFSYCATTTSILWENLQPKFVDIEPNTYNINANLIEAAITEKTSGILATHVYGRPCDVEKIEKIAQKYNLKVIYDGAHGFGATYKGKSVLSFGDITTCSFHATKVFHTIEGGSIICNNEDLLKKLAFYRSFGHKNDDYYMMGINGKNSEFHAAMGLCNLPKVADIINNRRIISEKYDSLLNWSKLSRPSNNIEGFTYNYAYYPVILESEEKLLQVTAALKEQEIIPRRYFYPSLNQLPYLDFYNPCPVSENIALRALSLPLYYDLALTDVERITQIINSNL
ncbi:DegT/DnrJ/EryC1/StrS aminotransferase [Emticicia oligotrophica DSM 17448]|uniref:DegT/DnrJ/EryC1/StrS aminotransferase n=1 Tax=Emticicia oligotrophica (strain DSM 17448 / CIP 109782 / MTCC 6937 / GPTSA100-15) TaxID=929562 RepID=A0ABM5N6L2_EMTOG|nr:DegT/DnrJ/EryC1/StrS family aminotransferase [Emticicia oligotrophica]AFK05079.1 DegT/DnrJ/EryC1/StrS aminotransferase [Emticicia oligotrophica DSM 17448]